MSALSSLSVASSVLQLIGFADTVFRAGKDLYDLFDKARSASRNIALLLLELQALLSIVAFVHVFISEHASSPFAQDHGHMLPNVRTILTLIEQDFRHLRGLLGQTAGSGREGWSSFFVSLRWALKEPEIAASRCRLAQYTQNLTAALSVSGRRNDIVLRNKLQSIEDRLQAISQSNPSRPLDLEVDTRPPSSRSTFRIPRRQARATCALIHPRNNHQSSLVEANIPPTRLKGTVNSNGPGPAFINCAPPKITIYEEADQTFILDTGNDMLHQITKPAMLLQDSLNSAFDARRTKCVVSISEAQVEHLQMIFDFLVASAHTASAEAIMKKYGNTSRTKLPDRCLPARKREDTQGRGVKSSTIAKRSWPTYIEVMNMTLDTDVGSVKGTILSARSPTDSTTLAFDFEYLGSKSFCLPSFAVQYNAHELTRYQPLQPLMEYLLTGPPSIIVFSNEYQCPCLCKYPAKTHHDIATGRELQFKLVMAEDHGGGYSPETRARVGVKSSRRRLSVAEAANKKREQEVKLSLKDIFESTLDRFTEATKDEGNVKNLSDSGITLVYYSDMATGPMASRITSCIDLTSLATARPGSPLCFDDDLICDNESAQAPETFDDEGIELELSFDCDLRSSLSRLSRWTGALSNVCGTEFSVVHANQVFEYFLKFILSVIFSLARSRL